MAALEADLLTDLGGPDQVTAAQAILARQVAVSAGLANSLLAAAVRHGVHTPDGQRAAHGWCAVIDRMHRALVALGIEARTTDADPYVLIEQAVRQANRDDPGDPDDPEASGASRPSPKRGGPAQEHDGITREAAAQDLADPNPPADAKGVMREILQAAEVRPASRAGVPS